MCGSCTTLPRYRSIDFSLIGSRVPFSGYTTLFFATCADLSGSLQKVRSSVKICCHSKADLFIEILHYYLSGALLRRQGVTSARLL